MSDASNPTPPPPPAPPPAPTPPWYEGKADQATVGYWQNKGWKPEDPAFMALTAATQYRELEKLHGVPPDQILKLPKATDEPATWNPVWERLGTPKEAKDYDLSTVKFSDGSDLDAAFAATMRDALHKAHVPKTAAPDVVKAVVKWISDVESAENTERNAALTAERAALNQEWGKDFEFNRLTAMNGARRLGVDGDTVAKLEGVVGYARIMEMFRKVGAGTTEDSFVAAGQGGTVTTQTGAAARIEELRGDKAFVERYLAGEVNARREMDNLLTLMHGGVAA